MPKVIKMNEHSEPLNNIYFSNRELMTISGRMTPVPMIGDNIQDIDGMMYEIVEIGVFRDTNDWFFGKVRNVAGL